MSKYKGNAKKHYENKGIKEFLNGLSDVLLSRQSFLEWKDG
jgi:hypothetical protein